MITSISILDPTTLLTGAGPWVAVVIAVIIFIETGVLFPFLPGDSLIFTAALLGPQLGMPLWLLIGYVTIGAVLGDTLGYEIGRRWGRRWFRPDARILRTEYLDRSDAFLARYGARAVVLARFVPIVRTFVPPIVGMSSMPYTKFLRWNILGAIAWATTCALAGHWLGRVPFVVTHVDLIAIALVAVSLIPVAIDLLRARSTRRTHTPTHDEPAR